MISVSDPKAGDYHFALYTKGQMPYMEWVYGHPLEYTVVAAKQLAVTTEDVYVITDHTGIAMSTGLCS